MKQLSTLGYYYMMFSMASAFYFCTAAIFGWRGPDFGTGSSSLTGGRSYYSGSSYGRSSGGSWGGGK